MANENYVLAMKYEPILFTMPLAAPIFGGTSSTSPFSFEYA